MDKKVLVTYATKHGATAKIAEKIADVLQQTGFNAAVMPVKEVKNPEKYQVVILGSAVYIGRWRKEAANFLKDHQGALAKMPVWLFSSGPTGDGEPEDLTKGWRYPEALQETIEKIKPQGVALFHGVLKLDELGFIEKWMIKNVKAPIGDFRDWDAITLWANEIAETLKGK